MGYTTIDISATPDVIIVATKVDCMYPGDVAVNMYVPTTKLPTVQPDASEIVHTLVVPGVLVIVALTSGASVDPLITVKWASPYKGAIETVSVAAPEFLIVIVP